MSFFGEGVILGGEKLLGEVEHHVIRYEVQEQISLHAHIIFWLYKDDVERVTDEIMAYVPAIYDEIEKTYVEPENDTHGRLFQLVK